MIEENVELKNHTNYRIGGPAKLFLKALSLDELKEGIKSARVEKIFILGGGTNVLVNDNGFDGLVIKPEFNDIERIDDTTLRVGSGVTFSQLNDYCIDQSLSGLEWSGGLPGTVGGAVFGNAGAFGKEIKDNILKVESMNLTTLKIANRANDECEFAYRTSIFKKQLANHELILSVVFKFDINDPAKIKNAIEEKIEYRKNHQPLEMPSAGSTFKNVPVDSIPSETLEKFKDKKKNDPFPVIPAAVFLADAGLMGKRVGDAEVSTMHPNLIVNKGQARAEDVLKLIAEIIQIIKEKYNIQLEPEIIRV